MRIAPALALAMDIGRGVGIDGFVVQVPLVAGEDGEHDSQHSSSKVGPRDFGQIVLRLLSALCDLDSNASVQTTTTNVSIDQNSQQQTESNVRRRRPCRCMSKKIGHFGWWFEFARYVLFIYFFHIYS